MHCICRRYRQSKKEKYTVKLSFFVLLGNQLFFIFCVHFAIREAKSFFFALKASKRGAFTYAGNSVCASAFAQARATSSTETESSSTKIHVILGQKSRGGVQQGHCEINKTKKKLHTKWQLATARTHASLVCARTHRLHRLGFLVAVCTRTPYSIQYSMQLIHFGHANATEYPDSPPVEAVVGARVSAAHRSLNALLLARGGK